MTARTFFCEATREPTFWRITKANDALNGGAGIDTMAGGLGDDWFFVDNACYVVTEALSEGRPTESSPAPTIRWAMEDRYRNPEHRKQHRDGRHQSDRQCLAN